MTELSQTGARLFIPDGTPEEAALSRITHLGIGAHQDDLEFMATHGILECLHSSDHWFGGVTCTDGAGSARTGVFEKFTDLEVQQRRAEEQEQAALVGRYGAMAQLHHPSSALRQQTNPDPVDDLEKLLFATRPQVVYTHQPADKHTTHIAVLARTLEAVRRMPKEQRPKTLYGCEVWRGLDWLGDDKKVALDVSGHDSIVAALNGVFDSQIAGGKRYDLAVEGRKRANATFFNSHSADTIEKVWYAIDMTPLLENDDLTLSAFFAPFLQEFVQDVERELKNYL